MSEEWLFTSESVSEGHPDKLADQISDAVVDLILSLDPRGKAAIETLIGPGYITVAGEAFAKGVELIPLLEAQIPSLARSVLREVGYDDPDSCFDVEGCKVEVRIGEQSGEIRDQVERDDGQVGAGDQGLMFGYASDETSSWMPAAIHYAHELMRQHAALRKTGELNGLLPDAKSQVTVRYRGTELVGVRTVLVSTQHRPSCSLERVTKIVRERLIDAAIPDSVRCDDFEVLINPNGSFVLGGPAADTGLTGRKIIVDTYGGSCPHGGGAFSGKDPSKVDRSAAYAARQIARTVVTAELARKCTVQLAYAIGSVQPLSLLVDTHGTGSTTDSRITEAVRRTFDLGPASILTDLDLRRPIFRKTASGGHFGRSLEEFTWETRDRSAELLANL